MDVNKAQNIFLLQSQRSVQKMGTRKWGRVYYEENGDGFIQNRVCGCTGLREKMGTGSFRIGSAGVRACGWQAGTGVAIGGKGRQTITNYELRIMNDENVRTTNATPPEGNPKRRCS
jgi:hypothetical protein